MSEKRSRDHLPGRELIRVEVFRLNYGHKGVVRSLSTNYEGCLVHWVAGKNRYHEGATCRNCNGKGETTWKGYFPAEYWDAQRSLWIPTVGEITSNAELDMRGFFGRGHVFEFTKGKKVDKKEPKLEARFLRKYAPETLRPPFDVLPVLRNIYNVSVIVLDQDNPAPDRVLLEPAENIPEPAAIKPAPAPKPESDGAKVDLSGRGVRELAEELDKQWNGTPPKNGQAR